MRVVIVTGTLPHHKSLCANIIKTHNVVGILHPAAIPSDPVAIVKRLIRRSKAYGLPAVIMSVLGKVVCRKQEFTRHANEHAAQIDFSADAAGYDRIPKSLIHPRCDVRQRECHELLRSLNPDVTLCLGGPVYPKPFIDASPVMLNFHSGISPLYNGSASIQFAFANGHPHLCGGTLMLMGVEIDGGRILGHFLPEIQAGDTPASLFSKTVRGAVSMYLRILDHLQQHGNRMHSVPQPAPLFYTLGFEFGWCQQVAIARHLKADIAARFKRAESIVEYWREPSEAAANESYRAAMDNILWRVSKSS